MSASDLETRDRVKAIIADAWAEAECSGAPPDLIASVALAKALGELAANMGDESAANIAERFAAALRAGKFSGH